MKRVEMLGHSASGTIYLKDDQDRMLRHNDYPVSKVLKSQKQIIVNHATKDSLNIIREDNTSFSASITVTPIKVINEPNGVVMLFKDQTDMEIVEQAKDEFVSLASHQMRTPLNVVSWYAEKLLKQKKGNLNAKQTDYVEEIAANNARMIDLVSD